MKLLIPLFYLTCIALLMTVLSSCSSTGYSGGASYYHRSAWDYDNYYRAGVNNHYNRSAQRANVRSEAASRSGGAARAGGAARSGAGRGGGGRR